MNLRNVIVLVRNGLFIFYLINVSMVNSQVRIKGGTPMSSTEGKGYMVYLLKASSSTKKYTAWVCGGAIVSPQFILTAAACVEDVMFMYAVAGYITYVPQEKLTDDECTKQIMRKVIRYCVPKAYTFEYEKMETWANIDIAVAEVDKPYDFNAPVVSGCSHELSPIKINYYKNFQDPGTSCFVMGWGHTNSMRKPGDLSDYNEKTINYATTKIVEKSRCTTVYEQISKEMSSIVEKYMVCCEGSGMFNAQGEMVEEPEAVDKDGCDKTELVQNKSDGNQCLKLLRSANLTVPEQEMLRQRRNGICQNDHGGPLVTWVGAQEYLIGIASVFNMDESGNCRGPYLYTSTYCNSGFLRCVLKGSNFLRQQSSFLGKKNGRNHSDSSGFQNIHELDAFCKKPSIERGFEIIDQKVNWNNIKEGGTAGGKAKATARSQSKTTPSTLKTTTKQKANSYTSPTRYAPNYRPLSTRYSKRLRHIFTTQHVLKIRPQKPIFRAPLEESTISKSSTVSIKLNQ